MYIVKIYKVVFFLLLFVYGFFFVRVNKYGYFSRLFDFFNFKDNKWGLYKKIKINIYVLIYRLDCFINKLKFYLLWKLLKINCY